MTILFLGDIVSRPGRQIVKKLLPDLIKKHQPDFTFANAENLAGGRGATPDTLDEMLACGIDYFTSGNHIFFQDDFAKWLKDSSFCLLRPLNYPRDVPGKGFAVLEKNDQQVLLASLAGSSIPGPLENPFYAWDSFLSAPPEALPSPLPAIKIVDFHAEFTSEKRALGFYLDGAVSALLGTHTHVPTADAQVLPRGSAYVTDVGMCGAEQSVLGVEPEITIKKQKYPYPIRFKWVKKGPAVFNSVLLKVDTKGKAVSIQRLDFTHA